MSSLSPPSISSKALMSMLPMSIEPDIPPMEDIPPIEPMELVPPPMPDMAATEVSGSIFSVSSVSRVRTLLSSASMVREKF